MFLVVGAIQLSVPGNVFEHSDHIASRLHIIAASLRTEAVNKIQRKMGRCINKFLHEQLNARGKKDTGTSKRNEM